MREERNMKSKVLEREPNVEEKDERMVVGKDKQLKTKKFQVKEIDGECVSKTFLVSWKMKKCDNTKKQSDYYRETIGQNIFSSSHTHIIFVYWEQTSTETFR